MKPLDNRGAAKSDAVSGSDSRIGALLRLLDVALQLATEDDLSRILKIVTNGVCDAVDCERASLFVLDEQRQELFTRTATELEINEIRHPIEQGIVGWVARNRQMALVPCPQQDQRWEPSTDLRTGFVTRNILATPVVSSIDQRLVGVLQLLNKSDRGFTEFDEQLIRAFAAHAATALERRRLQEEAREAHELQHAMEMGRRIQRGFLPESLPNVPGYDVGVWWQPAEFVSGDYYDWLMLGNGQLAFALGDVSGHGLGPSLIMASVRAMLHVLSKTSSTPDDIVDLLADSISPDLKQGQFITFLLVALDSIHHRVVYSNAGHAPALHYRASTRDFERLGATRLPLGFPKLEIQDAFRDFNMEPGDILILGTDGCIEVTNSHNEMFGVSRLQELVSSHANQSANDIVGTVRDEIQTFHGRRLAPDDSTLLIVKRLVE